MKMKPFLIVFGTLLILTSGQPHKEQNIFKIKEGMIKVAIMYPNQSDKKFDMDYYSKKHMPMVADLFGKALRKWSIDQGLSGRTPEEPATYTAIGTFFFDKLSDYESAFGNNSEKILGDIPNYTDIQPIVQISKVVH